MLESHDYQQWDYTRKDGKTVLLVLNEGTARIYADLPEAFVSVYLDPVIWVQGEKTPMPREALEQFAELFDLDVKPVPADTESVEKYKAEALRQYEADRADAQAKHEAQYLKGYESFVEYRLAKDPSPSTLSYILYDVKRALPPATEISLSNWIPIPTYAASMGSIYGMVKLMSRNIPINSGNIWASPNGRILCIRYVKMR